MGQLDNVLTIECPYDWPIRELGYRFISLFLSDIIPDIQCFYIIDAHATQAHCIRQISQTPFPIFGSKRN